MEIKFLSKEEFARLIPSFCRLYSKSFPEKADESAIKHRYLLNPADELLMCVAIDNDEIVANYSVLPLTLRYGTEKYKCAISINTMTDPMYSGKGLFTKMADMLYKRMQKDGYSLVLGFPNGVSHRIFISQLGWKDVYEIPTLQYDLIENGSYGPCEQVKEDDVLPHDLEVSIQGRIHVDKRYDYMKWRYQDNRVYKYHYAQIDNYNWTIYKFYEDYMNIVELHVTSLDMCKMLILHLLYLAKKSGAKHVSTWMNLSMEEHFLFEKLGFINKGPIRYFAVKTLNKVSLPDVTDFSNWYVCMGDDNVY